MATQTSSQSIWELLRIFDAGKAVFVISAAGILYDAGFFGVVGPSFVSLFSWQEHLVFALSGAVWAVLAGYGFVLALAFGRIQSASRRNSAIVGLAVFCAIFVAKDLVRHDQPEPFFYMLLFSIVLGFIAQISGPNARFVFSIAVVLYPFVCGVLGGYRALDSLSEPRATLMSGEQMGLVRAGSSYMLLRNGAFVEAVPAARVLKIDTFQPS